MERVRIALSQPKYAIESYRTVRAAAMLQRALDADGIEECPEGCWLLRGRVSVVRARFPRSVVSDGHGRTDRAPAGNGLSAGGDRTGEEKSRVHGNSLQLQGHEPLVAGASASTTWRTPAGGCSGRFSLASCTSRGSERVALGGLSSSPQLQGSGRCCCRRSRARSTGTEQKGTTDLRVVATAGVGGPQMEV